MFKKLVLPILGVLLVLSIAFGASSVFANESDPPADAWMEDGDFPDWFTIAGEALGMDDDALWIALEDGKTIAEIAKEKGVDTQIIVDAIVVAEKAFIKEFAGSEDFTQEEIDEWLEILPKEAKAFVEESMGFEEFEGDDWFVIAGKALNMDEDALWEALESGQSIADVAKAQGVAQELIVTAIIAAEKAYIDEMVTEGDLTQEEADEWLATLDEGAKYFVEESMGFEEFEGVDWFTHAGEALNMDEDALWEALESGQSIADLAKAQGVALEKVTDAILTAEKNYTTELLADGTITQEEADEWNGMLAEELESFANESWDWKEEAE